LTAPFEIDWDTSSEADGAVSLTAQASDACSNETTSAPVNVTIDNNSMSVSTIAPADGDVSLAMPASIEVTFDEPVDPATVDATTFTVVRAGGDGVFGNGNDVAINELVSASGSTASMDLSNAPFVIDSYRVTLSDAITDLAGIPLDGDGDGAPSGDFVAT